MDDNRDVGIDFGPLQDELEAEEYPLSGEELLDRYGDREVSHARGTATFRTILGPMHDGTFDSAEAVHQAVLTMIGEEAEGRTDYTDREPNARGEDYDQQSF